MSETQDEQEAEREPAGLPDADELSEEKKKQIEQEREERLSDENRPDGAEINNTDRTFDDEAGMFTDNPDYSEEERPYAVGDDEA